MGKSVLESITVDGGYQQASVARICGTGVSFSVRTLKKVKARVPTLLLTKKSRTFPGLSRTPTKNFLGPFRSPSMLKYKEIKKPKGREWEWGSWGGAVRTSLPVKGPGECCKLPQRGPGQSPRKFEIWCKWRRQNSL